MAFPREIIRLSELIADKITGALFKTAETGDRVEIGSGKTVPGLELTEIRFATDSINEKAPAMIRRYNFDQSGLGANQQFYLTNARMDAGGSAQYINMLTTYLHHGVNQPDMMDFHSDIFNFLDSSGGSVKAEVRIDKLTIPGMAGRSLVGIRFFAVNATVVGALGETPIDHGLGQIPDGFVVFGSNAAYPYLPTAITGNRTATQIFCRWYHNTTGAVAPAGAVMTGYCICWNTADQSPF